MITKRELVEILYQPFISANNFSQKVIDRIINGGLSISDDEFIDMYFKCTGHKLRTLRKGLYY